MPCLMQERVEMLDQISSRPDSMWKTGTMWSFRNDAKIYGTPMLDQAWFEVTGQGEDSVSKVLEILKSAKIPLKPMKTKAPRGTKTEHRPPESSSGSKRKSKGSNSKNSDIYVTFE